MMGEIIKMFSYPFMARAFLVGGLIALCSALLGVSLVLKKYSMIGDGLSHVGFGSLAVATAFGMYPLGVAIPVVIICAFALLRIGSNAKIKGDAAIALISTGALSVGIMAVSLSKGMNIDIMNYMFGSILAVSGEDVLPTVILTAVVILLFILFYNRIFAVTFDEDFSRATGVRAGFYNSIIAVLTAITIVLGMRLLGALLISSLLIFPPLSSMRVFKTFRSVTISSAILSVVCFFLGLTLSYFCSTPAGASVVIVNIAAFGVFCGVSAIKGAIGKRSDD